MGDWAVSQHPVGQVAAGAVCTTSNSNNTKGSYAQITSALTSDCRMIVVQLCGGSDIAENYLVDIAVGGSGSEAVIVPNIWVPNSYAFGLVRHGSLMLPVSIPKGTRVSFRAQCSGGTSRTVNGDFLFCGTSLSSNRYYSGTLAWGADTANSRGTVASGADTWTQLTAATARSVNWINGIFSTNGNGTDFASSVSIGIGGSGSEQAIWRGDPAFRNTSTGGSPPYFVSFPCSIPGGTRVAFKAGTPTRSIYGAVYGS